MVRTYPDRAQPRRKAACRARCRVVRCSALVWKQGGLKQCCLCVRGNAHCHHHRRKVLSRATVHKRRFHDPRQFTLSRRFDPTVGHRRLAVVGDGVLVRRSRILVNGSRAVFMGLFAGWDFAKGDMITIYDGTVCGDPPSAIPTKYRSHMQTLGRGTGNATRRILGYKSDGDPRVKNGHGGASIVSSTDGTGLRPNAKLELMDLYPEILYPSRSFVQAGRGGATHAPMMVLVALSDIRSGQEILRSYLVR